MHRAPHILIVEDTMIAQVVLKTQMMKQGCTVDTASDGVSALNLALLTHYDIILMDIGLGDGPDGFEVAVQIKNKARLIVLPLLWLLRHMGSPSTIIKPQRRAWKAIFINRLSQMTPK
ncbi:response regulator [Legionella maioricensis]|uniref:Response regulator n=1 Tax=Legionella maioricensis TaxID=2896528 RepID=A0A9X2D0S8_9GAMM|nr:response regulator [Legionella maioricensis]MCL9684505.1 response regulator [Legionella maioricensis]